MARDLSVAEPEWSEPARDGEEPEGIGPGALRWHRWLLGIGVPFGVLLLFVLPPQVSPDAPNHLVRIDQIARGDVISPTRPRDPGTHWGYATADGCLSPLYQRMSYRVGAAHWQPSDNFHAITCGRPRTVFISNTAINTPVPYLPAVAGYAIGRAAGGLVWGVFLARALGLAAYLLLCWLAVRLSPRGKPLLVVVALLPTSMTVASSLSADPIPLALGLLTVALVLRLRHADLAGGGWADRAGPLLGALFVTVVALALAKNLYSVMALSVLLVPAARFRSPARRRGYVAASVGSVAALAGLWAVLVVDRVTQGDVYLLVTSIEQRRWIRAHPLGFARLAMESVFRTDTLPRRTAPGLVVYFFEGGDYRAPPLVITLAGIGLMLGALLSELRAGVEQARARVSRRGVVATGLFAGVVVATVLGLVLYGEAVSVTPSLWVHPMIGGVDGRFFLPIVAVALLPVVELARGGAARPDVRLLRLVPAGLIAIAVWFVVALQQRYS